MSREGFLGVRFSFIIALAFLISTHSFAKVRANQFKVEERVGPVLDSSKCEETK